MSDKLSWVLWTNGLAQSVSPQTGFGESMQLRVFAVPDLAELEPTYSAVQPAAR
jgi:hypothetical protein